MYQFNLLNFKFTSFCLVILSYFTIAFEVEVINNFFFIIIALFGIFQNSSKYEYKNLFSGLVALVCIYIQFILNDYTLSKEYFLNLILILIFLKYSELNHRENYYFFINTCLFLAVGSLLYGQDLISSILTLFILIISIILLYSLNQTKVIKINFKNILKYLTLALSVFPIIIIIYLIFPRTEINLKLFETKKNNLGIPDKIKLGSFENISNNDEEVFIFTVNNDNHNKKDHLYFRVKTFSVLDKENNWISINYDFLLRKFSKNFKLTSNNISEKSYGKLILYPHDKFWVPKIYNHSYSNILIADNVFDNLSYSKKKIIKKTALELFPHHLELKYDQQFLNFYTYLPKDNFFEFKKWSKKNYNESKNDKDYLNKILEKFSNGNYFYNLKPANIDNDYEKFFFETKTGYCEYYAGTFAILSRLVGIPTRIVSGYYGGVYNSLGKFYTFKQQDAHSWVEVYLDGKWIRYDPTIVIPIKNIVSSNNQNFNNANLNNDNLNFEETEKINNLTKIKIYFEYANYLWTNKFIRYDDKERKKFIENKINNIKNIEYYFLFILLAYLLFKIFKIILSKKIFFKLFFTRIKKIEKINENNLTHQEIFNKISNVKKKEYIDIFKIFERVKFSKNKNISYKEFIKFNLKILGIKKTP